MHLIDIVQMAMNVDAPLVMTYENRVCNGMPIDGRDEAQALVARASRAPWKLPV